MISFTHKVARFAIANVHARAIVAGAVLGSVAAALAHTPERPPLYGFSMAVVMLAAGATSFVLHALHELTLNERVPLAVQAQAVRGWVTLFGCGVLAATGLGALIA